MGLPRIYRIAQNHLTPYVHPVGSQKAILGGKGAGLWQMVEMGLNVPPAFCITTSVCNDYMNLLGSSGFKDKTFLGNLMDEVTQNDEWLSTIFSYSPLVSVRSGAPVSMPGMMDTILNVGLTTASLPFWETKLGQRAAWDSYRRLIQMLGSTAYGIDMGVFDTRLAQIKAQAKVTEDKDLTVEWLQQLVKQYKSAFQAATQQAFPDTRGDQLEAAIKAVFSSWSNQRAIDYRKINKIDPAMGTACNVQAMVFGNLNDDSGTGVLFTRNPSTGENKIMGEFLQNAQGEDVVAGIRTPLPLEEMGNLPAPWPAILPKIAMLCWQLEVAYKDMVDVEFTVQDGELFVLQSRAGKRSASAAFKIAVDLVTDDIIDQKTALSRLTRTQYKIMRRPSIDPTFKDEPDLTGLPACPGVARGRAVFTAQDAVDATDDVILVTHETDPDDIAGMNAAKGILTQTGGATSHAAVVARAMDRPCVVGCLQLDIEKLKSIDDVSITIDGATGRVWIATDVPIVDASDAEEIKIVQDWAYDITNLTRSTDYLDVQNDQHVIVIRAAAWWDDDAAMECVFDELCDVKDKSKYVLDCQSPMHLRRPVDATLYAVFGTDPATPSDDFRIKISNMLLSHRQELSGLTLQNAFSLYAKDEQKLKDAGIVFLKTASTLLDLIGDGPVVIDEAFVTHVAGNRAVLNMVLDGLASHNVMKEVVATAVPADYAVFSALSV